MFTSAVVVDYGDMQKSNLKGQCQETFTYFLLKRFDLDPI